MSLPLVFTIDPAPPEILLPPPPSVPAGIPSPLPRISITNLDGSVLVNLVPTIGSVQPTQISGPAEGVGPALAGLVYTPPDGYRGPAALDVVVSDGPHFVSAQLPIDGVAAPAGVPSVGLFARGALALLLVGTALARLPRGERRGRFPPPAS